MNIDFKDEYATLRQGILERFGRIHDTAKYGTGAFIAFLSYYYMNPGFDNFIALIILQLLVVLIGMSSLRLYQSIYVVGTYIAVIIERDSKAKWHRMSRQLDCYEKKQNENKWTMASPFPLGKRWGGDSAQIAIFLTTLTVLGFGAVFSRANSLLAFLPSCASELFFLIFVGILFVCNMIIVYQLWWGMRNFMNKSVEVWKKYRSSFGNDFSDKYADC